MLNKAIKELMNQRGLAQNVLCVAMGQSESTFSRMFMKDDSDPKASSIALLARRMNIKVSDVYLEAERLQPVICRFFYSESNKSALLNYSPNRPPRMVYINSKWIEYTERTSTTGSSNWDDVIYLGEAQEFHIKINGNVQCPDLYKQLCDEIKKEGLENEQK